MKKSPKILSLVMAVFMLVSLCCVSMQAASWPSISTSRVIKAYTISTGNNTTAYTNQNFTQKTGTIYASDELHISKIGTNSKGQSYIYGSYPLDRGGRKNFYAPLSIVTSANKFNGSYETARAEMTAYRRAGSSSTAGTIWKGDRVYRLAESGSYTQVLFNLGSASNITGWRMGWISTSNYNNYIKKQSTPAPSNNNASVNNGTYFIQSALGSNKVLDVAGSSGSDGANIAIYTKHGGNNQKFKIQKSGSYYVISVVHSGKCMDVSGGSTASGANVQQWVGNNTAAQKWQFIDAGNGYYYIKSALGNYLDVSGGKSSDGTNVQVYTGNKTTAQKWKLIPAENSSSSFNPVWPCKNANYISTMYRYYNSGNPKKHGTRSNQYNAFDIAGSSGTHILAVEKGVVTEKGYNGGGFGNYVVIKHDNGLYSLYAHLRDAALVNKGDPISRSQHIGYMGSTGNSTGPHLHFEMYDANNYGKVINPWTKYYQGKVSVTVGGVSYKANINYTSDAYAQDWCKWLKNSCYKDSSGNYVFNK